MKKHKHRWEMIWNTLGKNPRIGFKCSCGESKERDATQREAKKLWKHHREMMQQCKDMHTVWHDFCRRFPKTKGGFELSESVEKWARKYPQDVFICRIDDDYHMGSDLVFILHRINNRNWGTTVVVIPQCENTYHSYFMYPSHLKGICKVLNKINCMKGLR